MNPVAQLAWQSQEGAVIGHAPRADLDAIYRGFAFGAIGDDLRAGSHCYAQKNRFLEKTL